MFALHSCRGRFRRAVSDNDLAKAALGGQIVMGPVTYALFTFGLRD